MSDLSYAAVDEPFTLKSRGRGVRRLADAALLDALCSVLRHANKGRLRVTLPSGRSAVVGLGGGAEASLGLNSYVAIWKLLRRGLLGFADAYMSGDIDTDDLPQLLHFFLDNEAALTARLPGVKTNAKRDVAYHAGRANTRQGSRRNIAAHYDLGNAFYSHWLDAGMSYSSGIYARPDMTLEEAQATKHARIVEALGLHHDHRVLEIGCGWGALARDIAERAAHVTAITISQQQFVAAREALQASAFADRANVRFEDYRDTAGTFDRVVSIEMIEAVGKDNWPAYFQTVRERLKPGGVAVIQAITIRDDLFDDYCLKPDFIQRYIFPGGMLPTAPMMRQNAADAGLDFEELERFGTSYALTLAEWRRRFEEAWPRIEALGFDERFRRMWTYYLSYCEVGFLHGTIDVGLYRLTKP